MAISKLNPQISIIICTCSRARRLRQTLLSLERLHMINHAEVIVVDNGSTDDTSSVVREFMRQLTPKVHIRYLFEHRQGLSIARNTGIKHSRGSIIAFLDDDANPTEDWLTGIIQAFHHYPNAVAVGGSIQKCSECFKPDWLIEEREQPFTIIHLGDQERKYPRRIYPFAAKLTIRKDVLRGKLNQHRKKGGELYYIPRVKVTHSIGVARLRSEWIKRRYYYQGVANAVEGLNLAQKIRIIFSLALQKTYIAFKSIAVITPGEKLLMERRLESIRGSVDPLRSGGTAPLHE